MLKSRSDANFSYGQSKAVSGNGDVFASFSQKWQSRLGGWCSAPLHRAFRSLTY